MRIIRQTDSELVIQSVVDRNRLILSGAMLGLAVVGLVSGAITGAINGRLVLICLFMGGFGGSMLFGAMKSETLTLDRTADQIWCDRKTLFGTQRWQLPLSALQDVSVINFKRRRKKANGSRGTLWFYTLKFVAQDTQPQKMLYSRDGDSVKAAYQAIHEFWDTVAKQSPTAMNRPSGRGLGLVVTSAYERWRETIWAIQPEQAGGSSEEPDQVYGVLMDVGMLDSSTSELWAISMSAFRSGDASFFATSGGDVAGLGEEPLVADAASTIIRLAQTVLPKASPLGDDALPDQPDLLQFALMTPGGLYSVADYLQNLQDPSDPLAQMLSQFYQIRQFAEQILERR